MDKFEKHATEAPVQDINQEVARYLVNELSYSKSFKSDYVLAKYEEASSGRIWYVIDGYFTLEDNTILFLDFDYSPNEKAWKAINNYVFLPEENRRFLLRAEKICDPFHRSFIGVVLVGFKESGYLDELVRFLNDELKGSPMIYSDGANHMIQDLTASLGAKPLFALHEQELIRKLSALSFVKKAMMIPSGRNPSNEKISQTYLPVASSCAQ